jgi:hypothetical protein
VDGGREALEGAGVDEEIQQKERELELWKRERDRCEREVRVLTLLLSTLRQAEREAKERYFARAESCSAVFANSCFLAPTSRLTKTFI